MSVDASLGVCVVPIAEKSARKLVRELSHQTSTAMLMVCPSACPSSPLPSYVFRGNQLEQGSEKNGGQHRQTYKISPKGLQGSDNNIDKTTTLALEKVQGFGADEQYRAVTKEALER